MSNFDNLDKVNQNIEELIDEIIDLKIQLKGRNCCYSSLDNRPECTGKRSNCQKEYYNNLKNSMMENYRVK